MTGCTSPDGGSYCVECFLEDAALLNIEIRNEDFVKLEVLKLESE